MNKKFLILLASLICALICLSPIMAAENNLLSDQVLLDWNPFADHSNDLTVKGLHVNKVKRTHTDGYGNTEKSTEYYLKFKVKTNLDSMQRYDVDVVCYDKNGDEIDTIHSYINSEGTNKIPLNGVSGVKSAKLVIKDESGTVIFENTTKKINPVKKVTKDKPIETKTTSSSSSSSSGTTYWASSNSGIFHYPSCEWGQKISGKNKVVFHSRQEALNAGYRPCHVCCP